MKVEYKLDENDFLTHQLYIASRSERIKKKRLRSKIILSFVYILFGLWFFFQDKYSFAIPVLVIGVLWFFLYPLWERKHYVNHYKAYIADNYKERINKRVVLELNNEFIIAKDSGSESNISTAEIEEIAEIPTIILIILKGGQSFILPQDRIGDRNNLKNTLKELANHLKINYTIDATWKWK